MDRFSLIKAVLAMVFFLVAGSGYAQVGTSSPCPGMQTAKSDCDASVAQSGPRFGVVTPCHLSVTPSGPNSVGVFEWDSRDNGFYNFSFTCPGTCSSAPNKSIRVAGNTDFSQGAAPYACDGQCQYVMTNATSGFGTAGAWTYGDGVPTGRFCAAASTPPVPSSAGPTCGNGSCYKPEGGGSYCASREDGTEICVAAPKGNPNGGGCTSSAGGAVCAGSPQAPSPPPPDPAKPDDKPPLKASDNYSGVGGQPTSGGSAGTGGASYNDNVTTYGPVSGSGSDPGTTPTGPDAGDGDDDDPDDDGKDRTVSGGASCSNPPPSCSGDAIDCAVLNATWQTRCAAEKGNGMWTATGFDPSAEPKDPPDTDKIVKEVEVGNGAAGGGRLDESGYGLTRTCPIKPFSFELRGQVVSVDYTKVCTYLEIARYLLLIFAYLIAAKILMGIR